MVMTPYEHQLKLAKEVIKVFKKYKIAYLASEERTGKTITSLLVMESIFDAKNVLIVTKKKAIDDWNKTIKACTWLKKSYTVSNYHSANKIPSTFSYIILDEAHAYLSANPVRNKRGKLWNDIAEHCLGAKILYVSATPYAQGYFQIYNQFALSAFSPWLQYRNFYNWYNDYGAKDSYGNFFTVRTSNKQLVKDYRKIDKKALADVNHLFITKTRKELNFKHEPKDVLHYIELSSNVKQAYNLLLKHKVLDFAVNNKDYNLIADTSMKLRTSLHMLEGGVIKVDDNYISLSNQEKIDYILKTWGDTANIAIMYQYIAEGNKLKAKFKNALILQGISYAEGVDLQHIEHLIIYSQDFSTSRHTQRRARQANKNRNSEINVHFLLVKKAISDQVYKTVSVNKTNYVDSLFNKETI